MSGIWYVLGLVVVGVVVYLACKNGRNSGQSAEVIKVLQENGMLREQLGRFEQEKKYLESKAVELEAERTHLLKTCETQFENMANKIFKEHVSGFQEKNQEVMAPIVASLKERMAEFNQKIETQLDFNKKAVEASKNIQDVTVNFVNALRGDLHQKGAWGEGTVRKLLIDSQLEFYEQTSSADKRPDFIVTLPNGQVVIIDSKTIFTHYDEYMRASDKDKLVKLNAHLQDVRKKIAELAKKKYNEVLADICAKKDIPVPDNPISLVLMFVNPAAALTCALEHDMELLQYAKTNNIALVTVPTLTSTLQIINQLWDQHNLENKCVEIKRLGVELVNGFRLFLEQYIPAGKKLHEVVDAYEQAVSIMGKDNTQGLIAKAQELVNCGIEATGKITSKSAISSTGFNGRKK